MSWMLVVVLLLMVNVAIMVKGYRILKDKIDRVERDCEVAARDETIYFREIDEVVSIKELVKMLFEQQGLKFQAQRRSVKLVQKDS